MSTWTYSTTIEKLVGYRLSSRFLREESRETSLLKRQRVSTDDTVYSGN